MGNGRFTGHWGYGVYYFLAGKPASSGERVKLPFKLWTERENSCPVSEYWTHWNYWLNFTALGSFLILFDPHSLYQTLWRVVSLNGMTRILENILITKLRGNKLPKNWPPLICNSYCFDNVEFSQNSKGPSVVLNYFSSCSRKQSKLKL